jgi:hypothetical protein
MKNLKKLLAVVLVVVLALGLMATASAVNVDDYTDADDITYVEAVDLFSGLGFLNGMPGGAFEPTATSPESKRRKSSSTCSSAHPGLML